MLGGDLKVSDFRFRVRSQKKDFVLFPTDTSRAMISFFTTFMLLIKFSVATDPFLSCRTFDCGVLQNLVIAVVFLLLSQVSIMLYMRCWFYGTAYNFSDIFECLFGPRFRIIPTVFVILSYISFVVYHAFEIYVDLVEGILAQFMVEVPSILSSKWFISYVVIFITAVPILFVKSLATLKWVAFVGNFSLIASGICLLIYMVEKINLVGFDPNKELILFNTSDFKATFSSINSWNTNFFYLPILDMVLKSMENPTVGRCNSVTWLTGVVTLIINFVIYLFGYLLFDNSIILNENIFQFLVPSTAIVVLVGKIFCYIVTLTSNMLYTYFLAKQVSGLAVKEETTETAPVFISGLVVILFYIAMNFVDDGATLAFDVIASISFTFLVFVFPPVFYLKLYKFSNVWFGILSIILIIIGIPINIALIVFQIRGF